MYRIRWSKFAGSGRQRSAFLSLSHPYGLNLMITKTCSRCGEIKPVEEFGINLKGTQYRKANCRRCVVAIGQAYRRAHPEYQTLQYRRALEQAASRPRPDNCEICGVVANKILHRDHNHKTGKFRGWLCGNCNRTLGHLRDDPNMAIRIARYLEGVLIS